MNNDRAILVPRASVSFGHVVGQRHFKTSSTGDENVIGQMAIAIALPGFNDLGRSVTPMFLLMDHFLCRFSTFSEKNEAISID